MTRAGLTLFALLAVPLTSSAQTGPYAIAGTVVHSVHRTPLKGVRIALTDSLERTKLLGEARTGADGRFRLEGLKAGKYTLMAERLGFPVQSYNQPRLGQRYASAVVTGDGEKTEDLIFAMVPYAVITGTVTDTEGDPLINAVIAAYDVFGPVNARRAVIRGSVRTNDLGRFRISTLPAGHYALSVSGRPWHLDSARYAAVETGDALAYPVVFYPSASDANASALLQVEAGGEARADIVMPLVPLARLQVKLGPALTAAEWDGIVLQISCDGPFGIEVPHYRFTLRRGQSEHTIGDIAPGHYNLTATRGAYDFLARETFDLTGREFSLTVGATPLASISGVVGEQGNRALDAQVLVNLHRLTPAATIPKPVGADGKFSFPGVIPGSYWLTVTSSTATLAQAAVEVRGAPFKAGYIEIPPAGAVQLKVTVDSTAKDVTGKLYRQDQPVTGAFVMLVARDRPADVASYRMDQSDSDGSFLWRGVPAGEYIVIALEGVFDSEFIDPKVVAPYLKNGQRVTITGEAKQNIRVELPAVR